MFLEFINKLLAVCTIVFQFFIVLAIIYFLFFRKKYPIVQEYISDNGIKFSFIIALVSTVSSLFYSNVAGFIPCNLCWFQRIFMYPEVFILGLAMIKKFPKGDNKIVDYALFLTIIGWLTSVYGNYIYYKGLSSVVCTTAESCSTPYVTEFSYVGIPMMALTAFSLIIIFLFFQKNKCSQKQTA